MSFNRQAGGHNFAFGNDVCTKCGMSRKKYEDNGSPRCTGQSAEKRERLSIPDDE
jgi:hypothetical protein